MSTDPVNRAKAALAGITAGPWQHFTAPSDDSDETHAEWLAGTLIGAGEELHVLIAASPDPKFAYVVPVVTGDGPTSARNAEFIAAARSLVPELVGEVEKLRTALAALVDPDDCELDHNGDCQAHLSFGGRCDHAIAKEILAGREDR